MHLDRLSSLLVHFGARVQRKPTGEDSNLFILGKVEQLDKLVLYFDSNAREIEHAAAIVRAKVDMGGTHSPLQQVMPQKVEIDLHSDSAVKTIATLITLEISENRCGSQFALDRLCDLLIINILRARLESAQTEPGVFAGLAHPRLRHVVVAIHDNPGKHWNIDDFVQLASMSRSQFMAIFQKTLGKPPMSYLKLWRMTAARQSLLKGGRVKEVARRFGYRSGDAFCRAFVATYGVPPTKLNR